MDEIIVGTYEGFLLGYKQDVEVRFILSLFLYYTDISIKWPKTTSQHNLFYRTLSAMK